MSDILAKKLGQTVFKIGTLHILNVPLVLISSVVLARALGPDDYGRYSYVLSLFSIVSLPLVAGFPQFLTKSVASSVHEKQWGVYRGLVCSSICFVVATGILIYFAATKFGHLIESQDSSGDLHELMAIALLALPLNGIVAVFSGVLRGEGRAATPEFSRKILQPSLLLLLLLSAWLSGQLSLRSVLWIQVFVSLLLVSYLLVKTILYSSLRGSAGVLPRYRFHDWAKSLGPFMLIGVFTTLSAEIGILMLGSLSDSTEVASLRVAQRAAGFIALPLAIINPVLAPRVVQLYRDNSKQAMETLLRSFARKALSVALALGCVFALFGEYLLEFAYGSEYSEIAYMPMLVLTLANIVNVSFGSVGMVLSMTGNERITLLGQFSGLVITAIGGFILIPSYGSMGAAGAILVGTLSWNLFLSIQVKKRLSVSIGASKLVN